MADLDALREQVRSTARNAVRGAGGRMRADLVANTPSLLWLYGHAPRHHFQPHLDLDGEVLEHWEDDELAAPGGEFPFVDHYWPGDHGGCLCGYEVVFDPRMKGATAWRVTYTDAALVFSARFENRRYDPAKMRIPPAYVPAARAGGAAVAVRERPQITDDVALFYRDILSQRRWDAELVISLALQG